MHGLLLSDSETHRRTSSSCQRMPSLKTATHHFLKDGRTISVGCCALFKPPRDSPPFIGIIRRLSYTKENNQLRVNWLYRPAELKLGKGILLDSAPNEIFYSFHEDDIPAASLLHPCRVAFLPNGVELPSEIASFVCRRVYDIENKCLWWLTDQDYIDERQEEVDQLLHKTKTEMQATVQTGGRSPKPINGSTSASQLRPGSDSVQNITSFTSQVKGKKRERGDQCSEPMKRERPSKTDGGDAYQSKAESNLKSEIAKITEKGGLVDSVGVEKLVHLMQPDKVGKKMDLTCRSILAGVIASTDKFDCLNKFILIRGLPVLDEWLQDFHKGKIVDVSSSKDSEKSVEDFLLVLLSALDKLPVNIQALQMCNIGRSVNHLRSHKNWEIQKKARTLVDTWKKRVEAEMNLIDAKSGSSSQTILWPSKSDSHGGNRNSVGSGDVAPKSSVMQLAACKTSSSKPSLGEPTISVSSPPGSVRSASSPASTRDGQPRTTVGSSSDVTSREDKSSGSSQSHNCSQSLSVKEETKSSSAGSISVLNKVSNGGSRHRKLRNGSLGASVSGLQKQTNSSRNFSLQRSSASENLSHSGFTGENAPDVPVVEGSSHKLIVKIPNGARSPAQCANGGSFEDHSIMGSRVSSPMLLDKHDQAECNLKDRSDAFRANSTSDVNPEPWQEVQTGSSEGGSPAALPSEEQMGTAENIRKADGVLRAASMSPGNRLKSGKLCAASICSMDALIESCVKYSETNTSMSVADDIGMNLLASVAAREMVKSDLVSPADSPPRGNPPAEGAGTDDDAKSRPLSATNLLQDASKPKDEADSDDLKHLPVATTSWPKDELRKAIQASSELCGDTKAVSSSSEEKLSRESVKCSGSTVADLQTAVEHCLEIVENLGAKKGVTSSPPADIVDRGREGKLDKPLHEVNAVASNIGFSDAKLAGNCSSVTEVSAILKVEDVKEKPQVTSSNHSSENENKNDIINGLNNCHPESSSMVAHGELLLPPNSGKHLAAHNVHEYKVGNADEKDSVDLANESERYAHFMHTSSALTAEGQSIFPSISALTDQRRDSIRSNDETRKLLEGHSSKSTHKKSSAHTSEDVSKHIGSRELKLPGAEGQFEERSPIIAKASLSCISEAPDSDLKMKFDLNEALIADDGKCVEQIMMTASICPSNVQVMNSLPLTTSSVSSALPASVTVTAAAKGPFFPPEDLLRSKRELGWKGSAATSAFRPTEPRKFLQPSLASTTIPPPDPSPSKHSRAPLDFDLNVPDERIVEDLLSRDSGAEICSSSNLSRNEPRRPRAGCISGGLDLDLNRTDEANDMGPPIAPDSLLSGRLSNEVQRDFDLNNGPSVDDANAIRSSYNQHSRGSMQANLPITGLGLNTTDIGHFSSWFPPGNSYSTVTIPSILPNQTAAPPKILGPAIPTSFAPDVFRGSLLSSSPAVPFPSTPFQYPVNPFGTTFPLPSATFAIGSNSYINASPGGMLFMPPVNSVSMGPADPISSQYPRPYVVSSLPEVNNDTSGESNRKWGRLGLDLNSGPGNVDMERREEKFLMVSNQVSLGSSQSLAEERARVCAMGGLDLKRKEPDGSRDNESLRYKQSSWQ